MERRQPSYTVCGNVNWYSHYEEQYQIRSDQISRSVVSDSLRPHRRQPTRLPVPGILQTRTPEWVAISFSNA